MLYNLTSQSADLLLFGCHSITVACVKRLFLDDGEPPARTSRRRLLPSCRAAWSGVIKQVSLRTRRVQPASGRGGPIHRRSVTRVPRLTRSRRTSSTSRRSSHRPRPCVPSASVSPPANRGGGGSAGP